MGDLARIWELAWGGEDLEPMGRIENRQEQRKQEENQKVFFLGKEEIPVRSDSIVVFRNEEFFVELVSGSSFVIRPRYERVYLRIKGRRGNKRYVRFVKRANPIVIAPMVTRENPEIWFREQYVSNARRNMQGHFIRKIWEHRHEFMPMLCMG